MMQSFSPRRSSNKQRMSREAKKKGLIMLEDSRTSTSDPIISSSGSGSDNSTSRKRGLWSRKRLAMRRDEHSVESTVAADESVSSGLSGFFHGRGGNRKQQSPHRPQNVPSSTSTSICTTLLVLPRRPQPQPQPQLPQAQLDPYQRTDETSRSSCMDARSSLSSHSRRSTMSGPVDVDDPHFALGSIENTNDRTSLSMLLGSMKMDSSSRSSSPSSRKLAECGPVDLDAMLSEEEEEESASENKEEQEGPVCIDESGPIDVDDYLPASGSVDSLPMVDDSEHSSWDNDFSGREYFAGKDIWEEEDDEFERCLCGYEEGFEPIVTTDASELFPPHKETSLFVHWDQWTPQAVQPRAKPRVDQRSRASKSTLAEC